MKKLILLLLLTGCTTTPIDESTKYREACDVLCNSIYDTSDDNVSYDDKTNKVGCFCKKE